MDAGELADLRRARRDFVRDHHPDRGGDAERFTAGLAALDDRLRAVSRPVVVTVRRRRSTPRRLVRLLVRRRRDRTPPRVR